MLSFINIPETRGWKTGYEMSRMLFFTHLYATVVSKQPINIDQLNTLYVYIQ